MVDANEYVAKLKMLAAGAHIRVEATGSCHLVTAAGEQERILKALVDQMRQDRVVDERVMGSGKTILRISAHGRFTLQAAGDFQGLVNAISEEVKDDPALQETLHPPHAGRGMLALRGLSVGQARGGREVYICIAMSLEELRQIASVANGGPLPVLMPPGVRTWQIKMDAEVLVTHQPALMMEGGDLAMGAPAVWLSPHQAAAVLAAGEHTLLVRAPLTWMEDKLALMGQVPHYEVALQDNDQLFFMANTPGQAIIDAVNNAADNRS